MPKLNHTGPENEGPGTGRKLGVCHRTETELSGTGEIGKGQGMRRHSGGGAGQGKRLKTYLSILPRNRKKNYDK
jgi:hypothetical protein